MYDGGRRNRVIGLLFLAIVIAAILLLIAGYGVAVGIGALAGLVLGAIAGLVGVMWLGRGTGRMVTFGGAAWSSEAGESTYEPLAEMRALGEIASIDIGAITSVLPSLERVEAAGIDVQLVSVEIHEAGLAFTFDANRRPGVAVLPFLARVEVIDDAGTRYRAAAQGQGGQPGRMRFVATAVPALSAAATRLDLTIERFFEPFPEGRAGVAGPWPFSVALPRR